MGRSTPSRPRSGWCSGSRSASAPPPRWPDGSPRRWGSRSRPPSPAWTAWRPRWTPVAGAGEDRIAGVGMPGARARTLLALAGASARARSRLERGARPGRGAGPDAGPARAWGPWTANLVAMRALGAADAFPAGDLGVLRALGVKSIREAEARAEAWRPWRAYAAMHLWNLSGAVSSRRSTSGGRRPGPSAPCPWPWRRRSRRSFTCSVSFCQPGLDGGDALVGLGHRGLVDPGRELLRAGERGDPLLQVGDRLLDAGWRGRSRPG